MIPCHSVTDLSYWFCFSEDRPLEKPNYASLTDRHPSPWVFWHILTEKLHM